MPRAGHVACASASIVQSSSQSKKQHFTSCFHLMLNSPCGLAKVQHRAWQGTTVQHDCLERQSEITDSSCSFRYGIYHSLSICSWAYDYSRISINASRFDRLDSVTVLGQRFAISFQSKYHFRRRLTSGQAHARHGASSLAACMIDVTRTEKESAIRDTRIDYCRLLILVGFYEYEAWCSRFRAFSPVLRG